MMTWLSEIEYIYMLIERPPKRGGRKNMAKMARVLREQAEYIRWATTRYPWLAKIRTFVNLSPDAKEIVKESSVAPDDES